MSDKLGIPMKLRDLKLRCFAERESDGTWFAMCLQLNLYARGDSLNEAQRKLHDVMRSYITDALTEDAQYLDDLLPRRAPAYFYLRYAYVWCCVRIAHAKNMVKYNEALPLVPAL
jgi:predicted RNase H-like HicB family nuclease